MPSSADSDTGAGAPFTAEELVAVPVNWLPPAAMAAWRFWTSACSLARMHLVSGPLRQVLVPEGLWAGATFVGQPPPEPEEVAGILRRVVTQLAKHFDGLEGGWPEDELEALQSAGVQHRLPLAEAQEARRSHHKAQFAWLFLLATVGARP